VKLRFADVKASIAKVIGTTSSDSRVLDYCNRAVERLMNEGKFVGTTVRYAICTSNKCLTWPREIETIEAAWLCDSPMIVRGGWYETLENGPGLLSGERCFPEMTLVDRGNAVAFDDIQSTGYKLAIYADGSEDTTATVLLRYYDLNANKVYTTDGPDVIEGEKLALPTAGNYTIATYEIMPNGLYEVIKPVTNRVIRLYARKISDGSLIPLAYYEPDEELPIYRRSKITSLFDENDECGTTRVTVAAKLRFIPATGDNSIMMISHRDAIRLMVQCIKKEEDNLLNEAANYLAMAVGCLNSQLKSYRGSGQVDPIRFTTGRTFGAGNVYNIL
jgi:hypothetical protein